MHRHPHVATAHCGLNGLVVVVVEARGWTGRGGAGRGGLSAARQYELLVKDADDLLPCGGFKKCCFTKIFLSILFPSIIYHEAWTLLHAFILLKTHYTLRYVIMKLQYCLEPQLDFGRWGVGVADTW